jgi:endonuclease/exonuclease/phosphatase family metal-dependent hydrolase
VKVVTFNLRYGTAEDGLDHWEARRDLLIETIDDLNPDIMGVQECLPFQADEIGMRCVGLAHFGLGRYHSMVVDRPHETYSGEHCTIFYRPDRFRLEDCGTFWHSDTPETPGSATWGNDLARTATWGRLRSLDDNECLFFCNTHFHWDEPYVSKAADLMVCQMANLAGSAPAILVGDFNATPESDLHKRLVPDGSVADGLPLKDVWNTLEKSEEDAGTSHGFTGVPQNRIDWILATPEVRPLSIERDRRQRDGRYPSDHFPVVAELSMDSTG